jgi:Ran GTPase-activating protein (RanGAP) involved in mRNA processing and transport
MEIKLTEDQKHKICDLIEKSLNNVRLQNYKTDDDDNLPLVDLLSTGDTILEGQEEISNIVEQIFFDMDTWDIQLKPVEIPEISDEEIEKYFKQWNSPRIKTADKQYEEWLNKYLDEIIDSAIKGAKWHRAELKKRLK